MERASKRGRRYFFRRYYRNFNGFRKNKTETSQNYQDAMKLLHARVNNLESNLHIEIDMERIEDRSKALSYIE